MKGSKLYSVFTFKCPKCQEGPFFESHPYNLKKLGEVKVNCPKCKADYVQEPGFYFGAMYVSYALGTGIFVCIWFLYDLLFPESSIWFVISLIIFLIIVLGPLIFSLSKIIWANMFIHYEKDILK